MMIVELLHWLFLTMSYQSRMTSLTLDHNFGHIQWYQTTTTSFSYIVMEFQGNMSTLLFSNTFKLSIVCNYKVGQLMVPCEGKY